MLTQISRFGAPLVRVLSAPLVPALARFPAGPAENEQKSPEDIKAEEMFTRICIKCHTADRVLGSRRTRSQWEETITTMQTARGAVITDEEFDGADLSGQGARPGQHQPRHGRRHRRGPGVTPALAETIVKYRREHGSSKTSTR